MGNPKEEVVPIGETPARMANSKPDVPADERILTLYHPESKKIPPVETIGLTLQALPIFIFLFPDDWFEYVR